MSAINKVSTNIEISKTELEATTDNIILYEFKSKTVSSISMKISSLNSNKPYSYYEQPPVYLIKFPLLKSPENLPIHHNSPNIYLPRKLKATPLLILKTVVCHPL